MYSSPVQPRFAPENKYNFIISQGILRDRDINLILLALFPLLFLNVVNAMCAAEVRRSSRRVVRLQDSEEDIGCITDAVLPYSPPPLREKAFQSQISV
jgi:hypothetical protein